MLFRLKRMLTLMLALILAAPVLPAFVLAESTIEIDDSARLDTDDALDLDLAMDESDDLFADGLEDLEALDNLSPDLSLNVEEAEEETAPALSTQVNSINASMLLGVWTGTYTGTSNGSNIERVIRLDIDYSEDNSIEGMATIDVGENGSYFFSGTFDPESGNISFKGTDWIDNPSNFSFSSFSGVVNEEGNSIQGIIDDSSSRVFSLNKTSDSYDSRRIDVQAVPRDWKGKYDGSSGSITVRRNYEMHIESLSSDGIIKGKAFISPSEEADSQYDATGSYYFSGSIDGRRGKIKLQGSEWIDYPEDFSFIAFEGFLDSSLSSITGKTENGIWEMKAMSPSPEAPKPTGITITQGKSASMKVGDTLTLKAKLTPKGAKTTLTWSSSKPTVATVTNKGKVKALKAGSTKITVKTANGKKAICNIKVQAKSKVTHRALLIGQVSFKPVCKRNSGDVKLMSTILSRRKGAAGGYYKITKKSDLTAKGVLNAIRSTFGKADDNDVSLFFIATHGDTDRTGKNAGMLDMPSGPDLLLEDLAKTLNEIPGKIIVILESCGSGAAVYANGKSVYSDMKKKATDFDEMVIKAFSDMDSGLYVDPEGNVVGPDKIMSNTGEFRKQNKFYVLTASRYQELSWGTEAKKYNYFTKWLTDGVGTSGKMKADTNKNGVTTLNELYKYISKVGDNYKIRHKGKIYYQHVQVYPSKSSYGLFKK